MAGVLLGFRDPKGKQKESKHASKFATAFVKKSCSRLRRGANFAFWEGLRRLFFVVAFFFVFERESPAKRSVLQNTLT